MELSSLRGVKFIVLIKERNDFDEINNFFMNNYWQAAGYENLLCRQPDAHVHHGELRYGTMGLIEFSFSAAAEGYDTNSKSSVETNKEKTFVLRDGNIITVALSVSVPRKFCSSRTVPSHEGNTLHLAVLRLDGRDIAENLMEIFTDRMYSFTPTAERENARETNEKTCYIFDDAYANVLPSDGIYVPRDG